MIAQRILLAFVVLAALALLFLLPRIFEEAGDPDVPPVQLREDARREQPRSERRDGRDRRAARPRRRATPTATPAPPRPAPSPPPAQPAPAPVPPSGDDDDDDDDGGDD